MQKVKETGIKSLVGLEIAIYKFCTRATQHPLVFWVTHSKLGFTECKYNYHPNNGVKWVSLRSGYLFGRMTTVMDNLDLILADAGVTIVA